MAERTVIERRVREDGSLIFQIVEKDGWGSMPVTKQKIINAFNFPYTLNPGSGCLYKCSYCFLKIPFFARHLGSEPHTEMNFKKGFTDKIERFLKKNRHLPQNEKRIQMGVATEMYHPRMIDHYQPRRILETFRKYGRDWMIHIVTKSDKILDDADLLAEMKDQVQVEVSLVTLDTEHSKVFERGTPSPQARLRIIEELSKRGIFVRAMCMPVIRRYKLVEEGTSMLPVYRHKPTGQEAAIHKVGRDNSPGGLRYFFRTDGHKFNIDDISDWEPVILEDYSKPEEMKRTVYDLGAKAFKSKDLNYYYVEELLASIEEGRFPKRQKGRFEDPNVELLERSGEDVLDQDGNPIEVEVGDYTVAKKEWIDGKPPRVRRRMMNYGYKEISNIDWVDCV